MSRVCAHDYQATRESATCKGHVERRTESRDVVGGVSRDVELEGPHTTFNPLPLDHGEELALDRVQRVVAFLASQHCKCALMSADGLRATGMEVYARSSCLVKTGLSASSWTGSPSLRPDGSSSVSTDVER